MLLLNACLRAYLFMYKLLQLAGGFSCRQVCQHPGRSMQVAWAWGRGLLAEVSAGGWTLLLGGLAAVSVVAYF